MLHHLTTRVPLKDGAVIDFNKIWFGPFKNYRYILRFDKMTAYFYNCLNVFKSSSNINGYFDSHAELLCSKIAQTVKIFTWNLSDELAHFHFDFSA